MARVDLFEVKTKIKAVKGVENFIGGKTIVHIIKVSTNGWMNLNNKAVLYGPHLY